MIEDDGAAGEPLLLATPVPAMHAGVLRPHAGRTARRWTTAPSITALEIQWELHGRATQ